MAARAHEIADKNLIFYDGVATAVVSSRHTNEGMLENERQKGNGTFILGQRDPASRHQIIETV